jgi:CRP-like cAMP-binding protein
MKERSNDIVIAEQLGQAPLFAALGLADRLAVLAAAEIVDIPPGDVLTEEGAIEDTFFVLLSGEASVSVTDRSTDAVEVGTIRPGETFGELGALLHEPRTATVIAERPCRLLRLSAPILEQLFVTTPHFGIAVCRDLAQNLRRALVAKNEIQANRSPEKVVLDIPEVHRLREYMIAYYTTAVRHVLKRHRLIVDRWFPTYEANLRLTSDEQAQWLKLFDTSDARTPFTYHSMVGTLALMQLVGDIGVNFKNLMHLKSEMSLAPNRWMGPGQTYRFNVKIEAVLPLRDDRVAVVCASKVDDETGKRVGSYRDFFIILKLKPDYVESAQKVRGCDHLDQGQFHNLANRQSKLTSVPGITSIGIDVPKRMGLSYGKISGDLNLVHTTRLAAALFGHPRPFIQGLCTANYVLRHLTAVLGPPVDLHITFARRVFIGERIQLLFSRSEFEVCDSRGAVLAFGDFKVPA